jgi:hypothetical protein
MTRHGDRFGDLADLDMPRRRRQGAGDLAADGDRAAEDRRGLQDNAGRLAGQPPQGPGLRRLQEDHGGVQPDHLGAQPVHGEVLQGQEDLGVLVGQAGSTSNCDCINALRAKFRTTIWNGTDAMPADVYQKYFDSTNNAITWSTLAATQAKSFQAVEAVFERCCTSNAKHG